MKTAAKKTPGRKNLYPILVRPRLEAIRAWRRRGMTEAEICKNLGVSDSVFAEYKIKFAELVDVLRVGKDDADAQVESAIFRAACGYEYTEVKTIKERLKKTPKSPFVTRIERTIKFYPPDRTLAIFYAKNRMSDRWHDRNELTGKDGVPLIPGNVTIYVPDNQHGTPVLDKKGS